MVFGNLVATPHRTVVTEIPHVPDVTHLPHLTHVTEISVISLPIFHCLVDVSTAQVLSPSSSSSSSHTTSGRPVASGGRRGGKTGIREVEEDDNDIKERCRKEDRRAQVKKEWGMSEEKKCPNLNLQRCTVFQASIFMQDFILGSLGQERCVY